MPAPSNASPDCLAAISGAAQEDIFHLYFAAVAITAGTLLACAAIYLLRYGLVGSPGEVSGMFALMVLPLWTTAWGVKRFGASALGFSAAVLAGYFIGVFLPLAALPLGKDGMLLCLAVLTMCVVDSWRELLTFLAKRKLSVLLWAFISAMLLVVFTETIRIYLPEAMLLGLAPPGAYYNLALAQMIQHYGAISLGIDGLAYRHYHFMTHVVAAGFAQATGANMALVYLYWGGLAIKVQLLWATLAASVFMFRLNSGSDTAAAMRLAYVWICVLFVGGFTGETFGMGTALLFAMLPLVVCLSASMPSDQKGYIPGLVLAVAAAFLVTAAKVSSGFFAGIALVLILWRVRRHPIIAVILVLFLGVLAIVALRFIVETDLTDKGYPLMAKISGYLPYYNWNTLFNYVLPAGVLMLLVSSGDVELRTGHLGLSMSFGNRVAPRGETPFLRWLWRWLSDADFVIQLLILSIFACVLVLFSTRIGANNGYFSWTIYAMGFLFLPMAIRRAFSGTNFLSAARPLLFVVAAILLCQTISFVFADMAGLPQVIRSLFKASIPNYQPEQTRSEIRASLIRDHTPLGSLRGHVEAGPVSKTMDELKRLSAGNNLVVNIPPGADEVWSATDKSIPTWCVTGQLMVPAIAGIDEIRSIPPENIERRCELAGTVPEYGFGLEQAAHRTANFSDSQLCAMARRVGAPRVYKLISYVNPARNVLVNCN